MSYLDSKRIVGTNADRIGSTASLPVGGVAGWKEVARTTLGSANTDILVSSIPDKRYYMILGYGQGYGSAVSNFKHRFNGVTDNYYSSNQAQNGGSASNYTGLNGIQQDKATNGNSGCIVVGYVASKSGKEKLVQLLTAEMGNTGASVAPVNRKRIAGKYVPSDLTDSISSYTWTQYQGTDQFQSGSEVVILGYDPADTHTNNFWQPLASVTASSTSGELSTGTFTAKKYLMIQIYNPAKPSGNNGYVYYNNVTTGATHSGRSNTNGKNPTNQSSASDYELTSSNGSILNHDPTASGTTASIFHTGFIVNVSNKEKLEIWEGVSSWTTAGAGTAPARFTNVGKWAKTDQAITSVQYGAGSGSTFVGSGSTIKVWGHN